MANTPVDQGACFLASMHEVTNALVESSDPLEALFRTVEGVAAVVHGGEAGIMIDDGNGQLRLLASSSERLRRIELFELQHSEGPCPEVCRSGHEVLDRPLRHKETEWPQLAPLATSQGFARASAFPLRAGDDTIGALNLFLEPDRSLTDAERTMVRTFTRIAAVAVIRDKAAETVSQLQRALNSRVVIEQAKGVLSCKLDIGTDEAFEMLRSYSRRSNRRISEVSQELLQGVIPAELAAA